MKIPSNMTEEEVLEIIDKTSTKLAKKFLFPGYSYEDIKQEAFILALDGLERYEEDKPLANFLFIHIKNRLGNIKRKKYIRIDKPCLTCPFNAYIKKGDICTKYEDKLDCDIYNKWIARNEKKKNLALPLDIHEHDCGKNNSPEEQLIYKEIVLIIDTNISISNRANWLQLRAGNKLYKKDREKLQEEIYQILRENKVDGFETWEV